MKRKSSAVFGALGWCWLAIGGMMFLSGGMALLVSTIMDRTVSGGFPPRADKFPPQFAPMFVIFQHFGIFASIQLVVAAFIFFTATQFMARREWARHILLVFSILGLTYVIGFGIFWIHMWTSVTETATASAPNKVPAGFATIGLVGGIVNMVLFSVPPILSIIALRGKTVRDEFALDREPEPTAS